MLLLFDNCVAFQGAFRGKLYKQQRRFSLSWKFNVKAFRSIFDVVLNSFVHHAV